MPWGDGTGPDGFGPRSGRGLGFCNGYNSPGYFKRARGFGYFGGRGRRFFGNRSWGPYWGSRVDLPYNYNPNYFQPSNDEIKNEISNVERYLDDLKKMLEKSNEKEQKEN